METRTTEIIGSELQTLTTALQSLDRDDDARVSRMSLIHSSVSDLHAQEVLGMDITKEMKDLRHELVSLESIPDKRRALRSQIQIREVEKSRTDRDESKRALKTIASSELEEITKLEEEFLSLATKIKDKMPILYKLYSLSRRARVGNQSSTPTMLIFHLVSAGFAAALPRHLSRPRSEKPLSDYVSRLAEKK